MRENLNNSNFLLYAAKHYDNPQCFDTKEFYDDLKRFKYIKRLFNRYKESGDLKEKLIINHLQILYNLFGNEPTTRMLFVFLKNYTTYLKPFLILFSVLPEVIYDIDGVNIRTSDIVMDPHIIEILRKI
mgnify:CR=1 FL=1|tara:strand:+ start:191 stop:577 length:387 start_codon:yes stop_codon:yes gene_type:complete